MAACQQGKHVRSWLVTKLITQLMEVREEHQLMRMKSQLSKLDVLILDELGVNAGQKPWRGTVENRGARDERRLYCNSEVMGKTACPPALGQAGCND